MSAQLGWKYTPHPEHSTTSSLFHGFLQLHTTLKTLSVCNNVVADHCYVLVCLYYSAASWPIRIALNSANDDTLCRPPTSRVLGFATGTQCFLSFPH